jgi:hypothetical protein
VLLLQLVEEQIGKQLESGVVEVADYDLDV